MSELKGCRQYRDCTEIRDWTGTIVGVGGSFIGITSSKHGFEHGCARSESQRSIGLVWDDQVEEMCKQTADIHRTCLRFVKD